MSRAAGRRLPRRAGNAVLEFALIFPLFWAILAGGFRIGFSAYVYQSLLNSVAGAGRYAARVDFDEPNHTFAARVRNMAVYGSPSGGGAALVPGLTTGQITVTWSLDARAVPITITVAVNGYQVNAVFQSFTFIGKPAVTVRYAGSFKS